MRVRNWKAKAAAQRAFSSLPASHRINYLFQRATKGLPVPDGQLDDAAETGAAHVRNLERFGAVDPGDASLFEFGAGWDLHMPLTMAALGIGHQTIVDIQPLVRPDLVAEVATRMGQRPGPSQPGLTWSPPVPSRDLANGDRALDTWLTDLGIDYRAPADARATSLPDASVDLVTSTNTMEHIPPDEIRAILTELHRILAPDGIASLAIDYQDHYSYFDPTISVYNFLRFTEDEWRRYNSSLHFQNRLRHHEYLELFDEAGFDAIDAQLLGPTPADLELLATVPRAGRFAEMTPEQAGIRLGHVVLVTRPT